MKRKEKNEKKKKNKKIKGSKQSSHYNPVIEKYQTPPNWAEYHNKFFRLEAEKRNTTRQVTIPCLS
jgi:hypothetical protein